MVLAGDGEDDLVEMPLVAPARFPATQVVGDVPTEFQAPLADRFVVTVMPRATSISSTIRRLSGKRKYSQTAVVMISLG